MSKRIAMISERASPLDALVEGGGQSVYVRQLAVCLARLGFEVDVFTRRQGLRATGGCATRSQSGVVHVPAGPATPISADDFLPHAREFLAGTKQFMLQEQGYHLLHANFWTSALVAAELKRDFGIPLVVAFHGLAATSSGRQHSPGRGQSPASDQFPSSGRGDECPAGRRGG